MGQKILNKHGGGGFPLPDISAISQPTITKFDSLDEFGMLFSKLPKRYAN